MSAKKALFFDNDGILVDTEPLYFESNKTVLKPLGIDLTPAYFIEYSLTKGTGFADLIPEKIRRNMDFKRLREERNKIYLSLLKERLIIMPQAQKCLEALSKKFTLGIVTSSRRAMFQAIHAQTGFLDYVDFVIDRESVTHAKPHPEPYQKALTLAKVRPSEALIVEDSERGLASAYAASIDCWVVPTELTQKQDFSKAEKVFTDLESVTHELLN